MTIRFLFLLSSFSVVSVSSSLSDCNVPLRRFWPFPFPAFLLFPPTEFGRLPVMPFSLQEERKLNQTYVTLPITTLCLNQPNHTINIMIIVISFAIFKKKYSFDLNVLSYIFHIWLFILTSNHLCNFHIGDKYHTNIHMYKHAHIHIYIYPSIHTLNALKNRFQQNTYAGEETSRLFSAVFMSPSTGNKKHIHQRNNFDKTTYI